MMGREVEKYQGKLGFIWFCLWVNILLPNRNSIFMMIRKACPEFLPIIQQLQRERHKLNSEEAKHLL